MGQSNQVPEALKRWAESLWKKLDAAWLEFRRRLLAPPSEDSASAWGAGPKLRTSPGEDLSARIESLTEPREWEFSRFKQVLVALATQGEGVYVPAHHRPDSIDLEGFGATIAEMGVKSKGKERGRPIFADVQRGTLVFGLESLGTTNTVQVNTQCQPGREYYQRLVGMLHVHPDEATGGFLQGMGFSDIDYNSFVSISPLIVNLIVYRSNIFLTLKTTATPNNIPESSVRRRTSALMSELKHTHLGKSNLTFLTAFNKEASLTFGLTLYYADEHHLKATRVQVTR